MSTGTAPRSSRPRFGLGACLVAAARGLVLAGLMLAGLGLLAVLLAALGLTALGFGVLIVGNGGHHDQRWVLALLVIAAGLGIGRFGVPSALLAMRRLASLTRRLAGDWCGVPIAEPYLPPPAALSFTERLGWLLKDPATWRDLLWMTVNVCLGWILAVASAVLIVVGTVVFIGPTLIRTIPPPAFPGNGHTTLVVLGVAMTALGVSVAPWLLRGYGLLACSMLAPAGQAELALRVSLCRYDNQN